MNDALKTRLSGLGWKSGTFRGYLLTRRAGIEFELGPSRGGDERLTLIYRYHTEQTHTEGEEALPADTDLPRLYDAMTSIYLRIHEKPDASRVFGGGRRPRASAPAPATEAPPTPPVGQGSLDL